MFRKPACIAGRFSRLPTGLIVAALHLSVSWIQPCHGDPPVVEGSPAAAQASQPEEGPSYTLQLPTPIDASDIGRYSTLLGLDAELTQLFRSFHLEYTESWKSIERERMPRLVEISRRAAGVFVSQGDASVEAATLHEAFFIQQQNLNKQLLELEDGLLARIGEYLHEHQWAVLDRIKSERIRTRCPRASIEVRAARIDLAALVAGNDLPKETLLNVDPVLIEYEALATPLFAILAEEAWELPIKLMYIDAYRMRDDNNVPVDARSPEGKARNMVGYAQQRLLLKKGGEKQLRLAKLNRQFLPRILELMSAEHRLTLQVQFRITAYKTIYNDARHPKPWHDELLKNPDIEPDVREAIDAIWRTYELQYEAVSDRMVVAFDDWKAQTAGVGTSIGYSEYRDQMLRLRAQRWKLQFALLDRWEPLLPEPMRAGLPTLREIIKEERRHQEESAWPGA